MGFISDPLLYNFGTKIQIHFLKRYTKLNFILSAKVRKEIHDFFPYKISTTTACYYTNNRMNFKLTRHKVMSGVFL